MSLKIIVMSTVVMVLSDRGLDKSAKCGDKNWGRV